MASWWRYVLEKKFPIVVLVLTTAQKENRRKRRWGGKGLNPGDSEEPVPPLWWRVGGSPCCAMSQPLPPWLSWPPPAERSWLRTQPALQPKEGGGGAQTESTTTSYLFNSPTLIISMSKRTKMRREDETTTRLIIKYWAVMWINKCGTSTGGFASESFSVRTSFRWFSHDGFNPGEAGESVKLKDALVQWVFILDVGALCVMTAFVPLGCFSHVKKDLRALCAVALTSCSWLFIWSAACLTSSSLAIMASILSVSSRAASCSTLLLSSSSLTPRSSCSWSSARQSQRNTGRCLSSTAWC